jgi:hypothetical protein
MLKKIETYLCNPNTLYREKKTDGMTKSRQALDLDIRCPLE